MTSTMRRLMLGAALTGAAILGALAINHIADKPAEHLPPRASDTAQADADRLPADRPTPPARPGCPDAPATLHPAPDTPALKPPDAAGVDTATLARDVALGDTELARISVLRPRSHLAAGPDQRIDPRPA